MTGLRVAKGHGTQNDFVLVHDLDGTLDLTPALVRALCDRRAGIGGDGVIRVVASARLPEGRPLARQAEWFMDYRNADGSAAQMCGNGARVFVTYLLREGLVHLDDGEELRVATRSGVKPVRRDGDLLAVDLGPWHVAGGSDAVRRGHDAEVVVAGSTLALPGLSIEVGNPHVVVALPDADQLAQADLSLAPRVSPHPPDGTNVELVVPSRPGPEGGHLAMRVHERGVGETRSCGTGAAAAVLAARVWAGASAPTVWWVDVPGGRLRVRAPEAVEAGAWVELAGPSVVVAEGELDQAWLARSGR